MKKYFIPIVYFSIFAPSLIAGLFVFMITEVPTAGSAGGMGAIFISGIVAYILSYLAMFLIKKDNPTEKLNILGHLKYCALFYLVPVILYFTIALVRNYIRHTGMGLGEDFLFYVMNVSLVLSLTIGLVSIISNIQSLGTAANKTSALNKMCSYFHNYNRSITTLFSLIAVVNIIFWGISLLIAVPSFTEILFSK